jgi:hypothetical protein
MGGELRPLSRLTREWLVTNGLGGYASGTICGVPTRRYHGLLIAAFPAPLGRTMMHNRLSERVGTPDRRSHALGLEDLADGHPGCTADAGHLVEFRLEGGLPSWRYEVGGWPWRNGSSSSISRTPCTCPTASSRERRPSP